MRLAELSRDQLDSLSREFPDAGPIKQVQIPLRVVAGMERAERLKTSSPEGSAWKDWSAATRQRMLTLFTPAEARTVRVVLQFLQAERPPKVSFFFGEDDGQARPRSLPLGKRREQPQD